MMGVRAGAGVPGHPGQGLRIVQRFADQSQPAGHGARFELLTGRDLPTEVAHRRIDSVAVDQFAHIGGLLVVGGHILQKADLDSIQSGLLGARIVHHQRAHHDSADHRDHHQGGGGESDDHRAKVGSGVGHEPTVDSWSAGGV